MKINRVYLVKKLGLLIVHDNKLQEIAFSNISVEINVFHFNKLSQYLNVF